MSSKCVCKAIFKHRSSLSRHKLKCQVARELGLSKKATLAKSEKKNSLPAPLGNSKCHEPNCNKSFKFTTALRQHLVRDHNIVLATERKEFISYDDFLIWKEDLERSTVASFLKDMTTRKTDSKIEYFVCNRAGNVTSNSTGKRKLKSQGVSKLNENCTASIKAVTNLLTGTVQVNACLTHYQHENQLCHIRLPKTDKQTIAGKLLQGIPPRRILFDISSTSGSPLQRKHLATKKDIHNITKRLIKLEKGKTKTWKVDQIDKHHAAATRLSFELITQREENKWTVSSEKSANNDTNEADGLQYFIEKQTNSCIDTCQIKCNACDICIHMYTCTCPDALIRTTICKHVHLVALYNARQISEQHVFEEPVDTDTNTRAWEFLQCTIQTQENNINILKESVMQELSIISQKLRTCNSEEIIKKVICNLHSVNSLLSIEKCIEDHSYTTKVVEPTNKKIEPLSVKLFIKCLLPKELLPKVLKGIQKIKEEDLEMNPDNIPDHILDIYSTGALAVQEYFEDDAWVAVERILNIKRQRWKCAFCSQVSTKLNVIQCHQCKQWTHWQFSELREDDDLLAVQEYFEDDAWVAVEQILNIKRQKWKCTFCSQALAKPNMIQCDQCKQWSHWQCSELREVSGDVLQYVEMQTPCVIIMKHL